jgi:hypothetical protein
MGTWFGRLGWSELATTSAPVQDETVQAILGMNQKHILFPCLRNFQPPSLPQNFPLLPTSPPPPTYLPFPTSFSSFPAHSISRAWESSRAWKSSRAWITQSLEEMWDTRLEEGGELNVEGMWRRESKRSTSSQMQKWEKKCKFPTFSAFYFFLYGFFFFCLRRKKCQGEKRLKQKGRNKRPKSERVEVEFEGKLPPFSAFFFLLYGFFFWFEKKKMPRRKRLKQKGKNKRPKVGAKSEKAKLEFKGKFPPFSSFFFLLYGFFSLVFFFCLRRRRCKEKAFETKG